MVNVESVFLGVSRSLHCRFYYDALKHLVKTRPKLLLPCAGTLRLAALAVDAGYKPENIECSDITYFSWLIGNYYAGKELPAFPGTPEGLTREEQAGWAIVQLKLDQLRDDVKYEKQFKDHYSQNAMKYAREIGASLARNREKIQGVKFVLRDLRDIIEVQAEDTVVIIDAPSYGKGYEKMFARDEELVQKKFAQMDFKKEFKDLYAKSKENPAFFIWLYYSNDLEWTDKNDVVFADQVSWDKYEYALVTKPDELKDSGLFGKAYLKTCDSAKASGLKTLPYDYRITEESKVTVVTVTPEVAMYYRDLWAHKLGATLSESYYLFLIDGLAFAICGIHTAEARRLVSDAASETYGFNQPLLHHPRANQLYRMLITCREFQQALEAATSVNRISEISRIKTVCITNYRQSKQHGMMELEGNKKMPDGRTALVYSAAFRPESFQQATKAWLAKGG